ncbi:bifunctional 2',3'-cyclic-nucleotide 2'-phosphodiesterase/3'-nucleotidase [Roseisalinus antarcticus]|uniref:2',3'-cyclic-nucleotide 2'-phosphodiesterase/3'-nucleotidase n=1 Tax=Roseisalinus antarcticus TaxID=254357 RepID=A0A1Y5RPI2_9RHOB|nr:bifunctional 2',3'-cyclic-nucleotide 2'-phosphodiesterase/3'-nucleotidase [Roseisalinus antarcticus]SLN22472.1 2',3'-cyclic-nucleotide 2'-phosphodiesterase/3'-nucleotidase precursor [Roseisalinus antarcticus]
MPSRSDVVNGLARLRILATTDLHVHLTAYDYYADRPAPGTGFAHAASLIRQERSDADNTLLFDNGDFLQGTPLSDVIATEGVGGDLGTHPSVHAMNTLGYDGGTLGNHEFNYGLDFLESALDAAQFPMVSANVRRSGGGTLLTPWAILDRSMQMLDGSVETLRIGIIGFAPPQIVDWDSSHLSGRVETDDIVSSALAEVPRMRLAGADLVVALCHSGIGAETYKPRMENAAVPLAGVPGIDVIVAGHTHMVFPGEQFSATEVIDPEAGTLHGKPAVMAGFHASHVGRVDLLMEHDARSGRWHVAGQTCAVLPVIDTGEDPGIVAAAAPAHRTTLNHIRQPIGKTAGPIDSYFALTAPSASIQIVADAQRRHVAEAAADLPDLPMLSVAAPFRAGGWGGPENYVDIPAGPLAYRHAADLYLYPNTICVMEMIGVDIRDWLERSASLFNTVTPGSEGQRLIDSGVPSYNFDVFEGLTYQIDVGRPARFDPAGQLLDDRAARVTDITRDGRPVEDNDRFLVISNSYRMGGGGTFRAARRGTVLYLAKTSTRDVVAHHLKSERPVRPTAPRIWSFAPMDPTTRAIFQTGPGALTVARPDCLHDMIHLGPGKGGFERFSLAL